MIIFFQHPSGSVIATAFSHPLSAADMSRLEWLYSSGRLLSSSSLEGYYVGPRRGMVSPFSTAAVEITQNMGIKGITRIEYYRLVPSRNVSYDPLLEEIYKGLDQKLYSPSSSPTPVVPIKDVREYNEKEGLALSDDEIAYLEALSAKRCRPLTDCEVYAFAQVNSEHCRHKIFRGTFVIDGEEQSTTLFNLIRSTTTSHPGRVVSAYKDNVAFLQGPSIMLFAPSSGTAPSYYADTQTGAVLSLKAETHNFPTTVEPFNGASTGTGGEIRDRMGGGIGGRPLAGTAVYMTASPRLGMGATVVEERVSARPWLYQSPVDILIKASDGASDFGNKFGQPLICGSLLTFEQPLSGTLYAYDKVVMLAGGVGVARATDSQKKPAKEGLDIIVMGGDNYRIGLGGGSVSSVETGRYASSLELNAVQRANPEMQKRVYNVLRSLCESGANPLLSIHDHGSAGHVNCLAEIAEDSGAKIIISRLPLGDNTLSAKEILANESQERMAVLVSPTDVPLIQAVAERERAPLYVVGHTTGDGTISFVADDGTAPFSLTNAELFGNTPPTVLRDRTVTPSFLCPCTYDKALLNDYLSRVLALESVACKDWLTNKVDRSVSGLVAQQQCVGPLQLPLADCGIVALDYSGTTGIATAIGHAPVAGLVDAAAGSILGVAEALTNIIFAPLAYGLEGVSLSANWMWPCRAKEGEDARLYAAVEALSTFCQALHINVPTGKDSLSMAQRYPSGEQVLAPGTVILSAVGEVDDVKKAVLPVVDTSLPSVLCLVPLSSCPLELGGGALAQCLGALGDRVPTVADADYFSRAFTVIQTLVHRRLLRAGHDISAGGLISCLLEMCFANTKGGMSISLDGISESDIIKVLFAENPAVVVQIATKDMPQVEEICAAKAVECIPIGTLHDARTIVLTLGDDTYTFDIDTLRDRWYAPSALLDARQTKNNCAVLRQQNIFRHAVEYRFPSSFTGALPAVGERRCTAAVIREKGSNSERELAYAFFRAGCRVKDVTMTDLIAGRETLADVDIAAFCGGFSNSDVLGSARGWAGAFLYNPLAKKALDDFYARADTLSLGVCNGCQLMIELGLLGENDQHDDPSTYAKMRHNTSQKFESAFVTLTIPQNNSVMFGPLSGSKLGIWVAHGEGQFHLPQPRENYNIVATYTHSTYPANPNGSDYDVAALASRDGRHIAIMPHPERTIFPWQCGYYPLERRGRDGDACTPWLSAFVAARKWVEQHKTSGC